MNKTIENIRRIRAYDEEAKWRTINGAKVLIKNGTIVGGAGGAFNGQKYHDKPLQELTKALTANNKKVASQATNTKKKKAKRLPILQGKFPHCKIRSDKSSVGHAGFEGQTMAVYSDKLAAAKASVNKKDAWRVDHLTAEEMKEEHPGSICHVTAGGSTVAVEPNGNIWGVCKHQNDKGVWGYDLIRMAVANGGTKLDSYDGNHKFYIKCGFEPVSWCKWNIKFKLPGWSPKYAKQEDVIFCKFVGVGKVNPKYIDMDGFKNAVPPAKDWGTAKQQRDERMRGKS